nr:RICIN domain-containing protein [Pedobacter sp. ASV19]
MKPYSILIFLLILFSSCADIPADVQSILDSSDSKNSDLKDVIKHYKNDIRDSLKLKAAYFLIRNMKHHYTTSGNDAEMYASIYRGMGSVLVDKRNELYKQYVDSIGLKNDLQTVNDIEGIKAKHLIENIDNAFKIWNKTPWSTRYNFEMFCEFILPYRVSSEKYLPWRETYYSKYHRIFDNINFVAGNIYETDSALLKNCQVKTLLSASNSKGVKMLASANSSLEITCVKSFSERKKILLVRYFNGGQKAEQQLIINQKYVATLYFPETGSWEKPAVNALQIPIVLNSDVNSIKLLSTKNQVILDQLEIVEAIDYNLSIANNIESGSIYKIQNKASRTFFTIKDNRLEKGIPLTSEKNKNEPGQGFKIIYNDFGFYKILPYHVKGKVLDLNNFSRLNGGEVKMWDDHNGDNQEWAIVHIGNGYYKIINHYSGKCLEIDETKLDKSFSVTQNDYKGDERQKWKFELIKRVPDSKTNYLSKRSAIDAAARLTDATLDFQWFLMKTIPPVNARDLASTMTGDCREEAQFFTFAARALGIPTAVDYTPQWPFRSMGHEWNVLFDHHGKAIPYYFRTKPGHEVIYDGYRKAKVFRKMFSDNPRSLPFLKSKDEEIPPVFNDPHVRDVTSEYVKTSKLIVNLHKIPENVHFSYLCIFNNRTWVPIFWSKILNSKAVFDNMGRNVVYLPQYYINNSYVPAGPPFLLKDDGSIQYLNGNGKKETIILHRKHPFLAEDNLSKTRMNGGKFQAANKADFSDSVTLTSFKGDTQGKYYDLRISSKKKFRYLRYIGPDNSHCNINELSFFDEKGNELFGTVIGTSGSFQGGKSTLDKCFDKDILTGFDAPISSGAWVGLKLNKPSKLTKVRFMPRTDGNCIEPGDDYELVYWYKNSWKILNSQVATNDSIVLHGIPSKGLYLLHNRTKGSAERIFTYKQHTQLWW